MSEIKKAMIAAQRKINNPTKDSTNPFLKNKYASLGNVIESVKSVLLEHGIAVMQECFMEPSNVLRVVTHFIHESGEEMTMTCDVVLKELSPQGTMGGFTYGRRYSLLSAFNLVADDDDGNIASGKTDVLDSVAPSVSKDAAAKTVANIMAKTQQKILGGK